MFPTAYIIVVPLGMIAFTGWLAKTENDRQAQRAQEHELQEVPAMSAPNKLDQAAVPKVASFTHERYGFDKEDGSAGVGLGESSPHRPIGSRGYRIPWLESQVPQQPELAKLPNIPGYVSREIVEPVFQNVPTETGFHISADEATRVDMKTQRVIFKGNVSMTSPQFHLTADQLTAYLSVDKTSFKLAEAVGSVNVRLVGVPEEKRYRGQSEKAVFDPEQGTLTLTGWPKVQGQGQELVAAEQGTKVFLYTATGKMLTQGRAQTRLSQQFMAAESQRQPAPTTPERR